MTIKVLLFGRLVELVGNNSVEVGGVNDTETLLKHLHAIYPALAGAAYCLAVDKNIVSKNTVLSHDTIVALLPQYAGG